MNGQLEVNEDGSAVITTVDIDYAEPYTVTSYWPVTEVRCRETHAISRYGFDSGRVTYQDGYWQDADGRAYHTAPYASHNTRRPISKPRGRVRWQRGAWVKY